MALADEPSTTKDSKPFWDKPDPVLRQVLRSYVDNPRDLVNMTREQLQEELRKQLTESPGA